MWTVPWIGVGSQHKLLLLTVYVLCTIYLNLTINPNDHDEPYATVVISISPIWVCSLLKYESDTHQEIMNLLGLLHIISSEWENSKQSPLSSSVTLLFPVIFKSLFVMKITIEYLCEYSSMLTSS